MIKLMVQSPGFAAWCLLAWIMFMTEMIYLLNPPT
jgi:hypothetical protein